MTRDIHISEIESLLKADKTNLNTDGKNNIILEEKYSKNVSL